jgi:hypothetical protein
LRGLGGVVAGGGIVAGKDCRVCCRILGRRLLIIRGKPFHEDLLLGFRRAVVRRKMPPKPAIAP